MAIHIIIDGYNLIRQSPQLGALDFKELQLGREALIDLLAAYKRIRSHVISVVFDGTAAHGLSLQKEQRKGIWIIYSRHGETADAVICKMAAKEREKALIVSSDLEITRYAERCAAACISAPEFEQLLVMSRSIHTAGDEDEEKGWIPTTKKKGPSRRRSRKARRNHAKIKKL